MFRRTALSKVPRRPAAPFMMSSMTPARYARAFGSTSKACAAGDTGSPPKTGGPGDAFQRREHALEDMAIRQREKEKLMALKKKLVEQQEHLKQLADHIDELTVEHGKKH